MHFYVSQLPVFHTRIFWAPRNNILLRSYIFQYINNVELQKSILPPTKEIQTLFTAVADWLHSLFSWGLQDTTSDMPSWRFSRTGFDGTLGNAPGPFRAQVCGGLLYWDRVCQWNREDPVRAARSGFLTCRSCYRPAKVWLSRFLTLLFRTECTNVTFLPPDIVPGCHIMYNISMLCRAWLLLCFCAGPHAAVTSWKS